MSITSIPLHCLDSRLNLFCLSTDDNCKPTLYHHTVPPVPPPLPPIFVDKTRFCSQCTRCSVNKRSFCWQILPTKQVQAQSLERYRCNAGRRTMRCSDKVQSKSTSGVGAQPFCNITFEHNHQPHYFVAILPLS